MKKILKVDNFSKITENNNSSNKSSKRERSKNIEEKINRIKNLKKLFLSSPQITERNDSNPNIKENEELNIKKIIQKKKNLSKATNKFYHSSLASISFSPKVFNKKRMKSEKNKNQDKVVILKLHNKNKDNNYEIINVINEKKLYSTNFRNNNVIIHNQETSINSIYELHSNNFFKNGIYKKLKKSSSNNEINYFQYINKNNLKLNNLRKIKRENVSHISSNAISNEIMNKYENFMIKKDLNENEKQNDFLNINKYDNIKKEILKDKKKLQYYYFKDIINNLTRNINLVSVSPSKEFNLQLLRNIDDLRKNQYISNTQRDYKENRDDKGYILESYKRKNNDINYFDNNKEKLFLSDGDINLKEIFDIDYQNFNLKSPKSVNHQFNENTFKQNKLLLKADIEEKDLKEDLKFLGNTNKLNWNLISEEDKHKGEEIWKKITNKKKDMGVNCNIKEEHKINDLNKTNKIITPKFGKKINIKNLIFSPEEKEKQKKERKTIILTPKTKLGPIKINNQYSSSIKSNNIFKIDTKFLFNENIYKKNSFNEKSSQEKIIDNDNNIKKQDDKNNIKKRKSRFSYMNSNKKILNNLKIKKKIKYYNSPAIKKVKRKKLEDSDSESNLDIISEEPKSININANSNEKEQLDEENEEEDNNTKEINFMDNNNIKISDIPTAPISVNITESNQEYEKIGEKNNKEEKSEEQITEEKNEEKEDNEENDKEDNEEKAEEEKKEENENNNIKEEENIDNKQDETGDNKNNDKKNYKKIKYPLKKKYSEKQDISIFQVDEYNQKLLLKKLKSKRKKTKKIKPSIYSFLNDLKSKKISSETKIESAENKPHVRKYFQNIDTNSLRDINKRKIELLFKIKHDLEFKIKQGDIKSNEKLEFKDLELKIYSTKIETFDQKGINEYLDKLEGFFNSFENDITNAERRKKDEERINGFRKDLIDKISYSEILREKKEKFFGNVIDFNIVNHLNELSVLENEKDNGIRNNITKY